MEQLPLCIYVGPVEEAVLYANELVAGLVEFQLKADADNPTIRTSYEVVNCFPRPSGHGVQDRAGADEAFPLRIYVGDDVNTISVSFKGRPFSALSGIYVKLSTTQKRIIRITSYNPFPEELEIALLDLGVELIVEPSKEEIH